MAEYIERAAAIKALGERPLNWDDKPDEVQAVWDYDLHRSAILSVRAADVVPVVRCRECKHFNPETHECENESLSTDHEGGASYSLNFSDDDFCSYGDRR